MRNINRAEAILAARYQTDQMEGDGAANCFNADDAADALAKAGLLAPDLPQVTHRAGMGLAGPDFLMTSGRFARVNLPNGTEYLWTMFNPGSVTLIHNLGKRADAKGREWPDTRDMHLTPDDAREIAYTLLAAANHAEGDTDD